MKPASLFFLPVLLLALAGCGRKKPDAVPAKIEPTKPDSQGSAVKVPSKEETPSTTSGPAAKSESTTKNSGVSAAPPRAADDGIRALAARLVEKSPTGTWRINEGAALELEKLGAKGQADLADLLADETTEARRGAAFYLLARFNASDKQQVAGYSALLGDADPFLRNLGLQAVRKMHKNDQAAAAPKLAGLLSPKQEASEENRASVARLLGSLKQEAASAIDSLRAGAKEDPSPKVRGACLVAISQIAAPTEALPAYRQGLADADAAVRLVAAARLRQLGAAAAPAVSELAAALEDKDPRVIEAAAEALALVGSDAVEPVSPHVDSKNAHTRQMAIACLGKIGAPAKSALPLVEKHLTDENAEVKAVADAVVKILKGP